MKGYKWLSRKLLSCLLALAVVVSSVTVTLSVFADEPSAQAEDPYTVTYGSPAIPLHVGKMVNLDNVEVQFTADGTPVSGKDITWTIDGTPVKAVSATEVGKTELVASYGGSSKKVYAIAAEQGSLDFYIEYRDLTTGFDKTEWIQAESRYGTENNTTDLTTYNNNAKTSRLTSYYYPIAEHTSQKSGYTAQTNQNGANANMLLLNSEALKQFANYTIEATVYSGSTKEAVTTTKSTGDTTVYRESHYGGMSIIARADVADSIRLGSGVSIFNNHERNNEAVAMAYEMNRFGGLGVAGLKKYSSGNTSNGLLNVTGTTGDGENYRPLTSLTGDDLKKIEGIVSTGDPKNITDYTDYTDPATVTVYPHYNEKIYLTDTTDDSYRLAGAVKTDVRITLNNEDVKYEVSENGKNEYHTILDTSAGNKIYQTDITNYNSKALDNGPLSEGNRFTEYTKYHTDFDTKGTLKPGTVGFASDAGTTARYYSLGVKLNVTSAEELPVMSDIIAVNPNAPALGMYVNTQVSLSNLVVTLDNGATFLGADLNWKFGTIGDSNEILLNENAKTFAAFKTGVYQLEASLGEHSAKVYFIVNAQTEDRDFYLVNLDLTKESNYDPADWLLVAGTDAANNGAGSAKNYDAAYTNDGVHYRMYYYLLDTVNDNDFKQILAYDDAEAAMSITRKNDYLNRRPIQILYDNAVLKDFADYTVSADVKYDRGSTNTTAANRATNTFNKFMSFGLVTRANYTVTDQTEKYTVTELGALDSTTEDKGIYSATNTALITAAHAYSALKMYSPSKDNISTVYDKITNGLFTLAGGTVFDYNNLNDSNTIVNTGDIEKYSLGYDYKKTVTVSLNAADLTYSIAKEGGEATTIFDSTDTANMKKISYSYYSGTSTLKTSAKYTTGINLAADGTTNAGTVGFTMAGFEGMLIYNLKVKANLTDDQILTGVPVTKLSMPVNYAYRPADVTELEGLTIDDANSVDYIVEGDYIIATSTGTIIYTGNTGKVIINVGESATANDIKGIKPIADSRLAITKPKNTYVFTVKADQKIIPGSFKVKNSEGKVVGHNVESDGTDVVFSLKAEISLCDATVSADFETGDLKETYSIGQQVNTNTLGLRFLSAVTSLKRDTATIGTSQVKTQDNEEIDSIYAVIIPTELLGEKIDENNIDWANYNVDDTDITITGAKADARVIKFKTCNDTHGYYTQFVNTLTGIETDMQDVKITSLFFIKKTGAEKPVLCHSAETSYSEAAAQ